LPSLIDEPPGNVASGARAVFLDGGLELELRPLEIVVAQEHLVGADRVRLAHPHHAPARGGEAEGVGEGQRALPLDRAEARRIIAEDHLVLAVLEADAEINALLAEETSDEIQIALPVLHRVDPRRIAPGELLLLIACGDPPLREHLLHDIGDALLLERPAIGALAEAEGQVTRILAMGALLVGRAHDLTAAPPKVRGLVAPLEGIFTGLPTSVSGQAGPSSSRVSVVTSMIALATRSSSARRTRTIRLSVDDLPRTSVYCQPSKTSLAALRERPAELDEQRCLDRDLRCGRDHRPAAELEVAPAP
jgi:hypothetical protein